MPRKESLQHPKFVQLSSDTFKREKFRLSLVESLDALTMTPTKLHMVGDSLLFELNSIDTAHNFG